MVDTDGVCRVTVGATGGADALEAARETGSDVREVVPTGTDALEPLAVATRDGRTAFHANVTPDRARSVASALADGRVRTGGAHAVVDHDPGADALPRPARGPLGTGVGGATATCGWADPVDPSAVVDGISADLVALRDRVRDSGFRGRGRGEYKVASVRVEPVGPEPEGEPLGAAGDD
jgi:NADH-quinone oxidoreductase subunit F